MKTTIYVGTFLIPDDYSAEGFHLSYHSYKNEEHVREHNPESWILLQCTPVEIEDPEFDVREVLLESLEGQKRELMAEYAKSMASIEDRISKLLALEVLS